MKENLPFAGNTIYLDEDQRNEVMRMSALNYTAQDIAIYLELGIMGIKQFEMDAITPYTDIWLLIRKGKLSNQVAPELKLQTLAEEGNITAYQELAKLSRQKNFETIVKQLDEDEI